MLKDRFRIIRNTNVAAHSLGEAGSIHSGRGTAAEGLATLLSGGALSLAKKAAYLAKHDPRLLLAQLSGRSRLFLGLVPRGTVQGRINGLKFEFDLELDFQVRKMLLGLYEPLVRIALRELLAPGDTFIDVGANIGYLSAIGAATVGSTGEVHAFEPVPDYFQRLMRLCQMNPQYRIVANRLSAGDLEGSFTLYLSRSNLGENTIIRGLNREDDNKAVREAPMIRLDAYISQHSLANITCIKIDTEGYEYPVLRGLGGFLENTTRFPAIIAEIFPPAYPLIGANLRDLSGLMSSYGYRAYPLDALGTQAIDITSLTRVLNVAFLHSSWRSNRVKKGNVANPGARGILGL